MHLRRINNPKRVATDKTISLSCEEMFYFDSKPVTPDLKSTKSVEKKQDKQQAA